MHKKPIISFCIVLLVSACSKVPITNRKQLNMLPESQLISLSLTNYKDFLSKNPAVYGNSDADLVQRVGVKIKNAVVQFMKSNGYSKRIKGYRWEFNLVNSTDANAWCMPGGKVVVYSGLLPLTQTEGGLAIVMGHEIAHAIARHGNERMSQGLLTSMGGIALDVALSQKSEETRSLFLSAYGIAATAGVILPYSRSHETESDKLGMIFAAMAGYDPGEAIGFWERMSRKGKSNVPEIFSTHPSDSRRIADIKAYLPTAMKYYKPQ